LSFLANENIPGGSAWLAQSEEHATLNLGVVSLSPTLGVEMTKKMYT